MSTALFGALVVVTGLSNVTWRAAARDEASRLRAELERARAANLSLGDDNVEVRQINDCLTRAEQATDPSGWRWLPRWASGSDVESAWRALHAADQGLLMIQSPDVLKARLPELCDAAEERLASTQVKLFLKSVKKLPPNEDPGPFRTQLRMIKRKLDGQSDDAHTNVRNYRNWLLIVSGILLAGLTVAVLGHALDSEFITICQSGSKPGDPCVAPYLDVFEVVLLGAVGGLIAALRALGRLTSYSGLVALPLWQALIRVPAGAATALLGVLVIQSGLLSTFKPQSHSGLIAYAIVFGYAPDFLLRPLDQKVNEATSKASPTGGPASDSASSIGRRRRRPDSS